MTTLVTGGGGFLGGAIVRQLLARGEAVRVFSRGAYPELEALGVEVVRGDLAEPIDVDQAVMGCDVVYHVAAKPGVWGSYASYYRPNTLGTLNVIAACRKQGASRLVYTSTPSVVHAGGDIEGLDESMPYAERYATHYPATKALAERAVLAANGEGLATVALRPHLIWGPGDNHLVPRILARAKSGRLRLVGKPSPAVDSTYIDDGARAHLMAADELSGAGRCAGRAYFISQGEPWAMDDLINGILAAADMPPCESWISARMAWWVGAILEGIYTVLRIAEEPPITRFLAIQLSTAHYYDISAAERDFGFRPTVTIVEGLRRLGESLKDR
jgi:nucleoside-diphosphate-sugar epimerase